MVTIRGKLQLIPLHEGHHGRYRHKAPLIVLQLPPLCEGHILCLLSCELGPNITTPTPLRGVSTVHVVSAARYNSCPSARGMKGPQEAVRNFSDYNSRPSKMGITIVQNIHDAVNKLQLVPLCERHFQLFRIAVLYKHYNSRPSARGIKKSVGERFLNCDYNSCPSVRGYR